ncbi:MAG: hypothetical protein K8H88_12065, partial [Sandaracinaceae bacterium]|nr:hypothetical protein [Sandaracinaceae bacterium]
VHAAIDPTRRRSVIAICQVPEGREVVRLDFQTPACETLVPLDAVPPGMRPSYVAFAQGR